jgi:hypothetical protein
MVRDWILDLIKSDPDPDQAAIAAALPVTALELRTRGHAIPPEIPDVAWVPAGSIVTEYKTESIGNGRLNGVMTMRFTEPFRWTEVTLTDNRKDDPSHE